MNPESFDWCKRQNLKISEEFQNNSTDIDYISRCEVFYVEEESVLPSYFVFCCARCDNRIHVIKREPTIGIQVVDEVRRHDQQHLLPRDNSAVVEPLKPENSFGALNIDKNKQGKASIKSVQPMGRSSLGAVASKEQGAEGSDRSNADTALASHDHDHDSDMKVLKNRVKNIRDYLGGSPKTNKALIKEVALKGFYVKESSRNYVCLRCYVCGASFSVESNYFTQERLAGMVSLNLIDDKQALIHARSCRNNPVKSPNNTQHRSRRFRAWLTYIPQCHARQEKAEPTSAVRYRCQICFGRAIDYVAFLPCGQMYTCARCRAKNKLTKGKQCPFCRSQIEDTAVIYLPDMESRE